MFLEHRNYLKQIFLSINLVFFKADYFIYLFNLCLRCLSIVQLK